jgi:hypothetical protein
MVRSEEKLVEVEKDDGDDDEGDDETATGRIVSGARDFSTLSSHDVHRNEEETGSKKLPKKRTRRPQPRRTKRAGAEVAEGSRSCDHE